MSINMKILLIGCNGQVGWELKRTLSDLGNLIACGRKELDLNDFELIRGMIGDYKPDIIVNSAAYTAVDKAESDIQLAKRINGDAVKIIAEETEKLGAWLIHYSTDYVFDGAKESPYKESDKTNPLGIYGKTKLAGERAIQESGCHYTVFRTSWVIGRHGNNFIKTILRLAKERESLNVVSDQVGAPTSAHLIAKVTALVVDKIIRNKWQSGIYHLTSSGQTTWYDVAKFVVMLANEKKMPIKLKDDAINAISSSEYPTAAKRPLNSRLDISKLESLLNMAFPCWEKDIEEIINDVAKERLIA